jgi:hypothetical protein
MGGTLIKLVEKRRSVLIVDLCDGDPTRYASRGERAPKPVRRLTFLGDEQFTAFATGSSDPGHRFGAPCRGSPH